MAIRSDLELFTRAELRQLALEMGVERGKNKRDVIDNLLAAGVVVAVSVTLPKVLQVGNMEQRADKMLDYAKRRINDDS